MGPFPSDLMGEGRHLVLNSPFQAVLDPAAFKKIFMYVYVLQV